MTISLKDGQRLQYETKDKEDLRVAVVGSANIGSVGKRLFIHFNGQIVHSCIGLPSLKKRLEKLITKWDLQAVPFDEDAAPF